MDKYKKMTKFELIKEIAKRAPVDFFQVLKKYNFLDSEALRRLLVMWEM